MKKYIEQVKQRSTHERRQVAVRVAASITGVMALAWMATLGVRLANPAPKTAAQQGFENQIASVFSAFSLQGKQDNTLEVATTTNQ